MNTPYKKLLEKWLVSNGDNFSNATLTSGETVNLVTGELSSGITAVTYAVSKGYSLLDCRYLLGRGDKPTDLLALYNDSEPMGASCREWCSLRGIPYSLGEQVKLRERVHDSFREVIFPYFDIHNNLVDLGFCDPTTGTPTQNILSNKFLYNPYQKRKPFNTVLLVKGQSDVLRLVAELDKHGISDIGVYGLPDNQLNRELLREVQMFTRKVVIPKTNSEGIRLIDSVSKIAPSFIIAELPWQAGQKGNDFTDWISYPQNNFQDLVTTLFRPSHPPREVLDDNTLFVQTTEKPKEWIINNFMAKGEVAILGGAQKARKTWLAMNLLNSVVSGTELWGLKQYIGNPKTRVLFIQEEGNLSDFRDRRSVVLGANKFPNVFWLHDSGLKFDDDSDIEWLINQCREKKIDFIIADPLQNLRSVINENSAGDVHKFWENTKKLKRECNLAILFLHHFNQGGDVSKGWAALRGTSRDAGQADIGIFTEKVERPNHFNKVCVDGREIHCVYPNGKYFHLRADFRVNSAGKLTKAEFLSDTAGGIRPTLEQLEIDFVSENAEEWLLTECSERYGVTAKTITNWLANSVLLVTTKPSKGNPVKIIKK